MNIGSPAAAALPRSARGLPATVTNGTVRPPTGTRKGVHALQTIARIAAWLVLLGLVLVTLVPIGFRPHSGLSPQVERFIAFAIAGALLALAYPRRPLLALALVAALAVGLELAQFAAATRHPGLPDLFAKALGGATGLVGGWGLNLIAAALSQRRPGGLEP